MLMPLLIMRLMLSIISFFIVDVVIKQADWDTSKAREKLRRDIEGHAVSVRSAELSELSAYYEVLKMFFGKINSNFSFNLLHVGYYFIIICL